MYSYTDDEILFHLKKKSLDSEFNLVVSMLLIPEGEMLNFKKIREITKISQHQLTSILSYLEGARMIEKTKCNELSRNAKVLKLTNIGKRYLEYYADTPYYEDTLQKLESLEF